MVALLVGGCRTLPARHGDAEWTALSGPLFAETGPSPDDVFQGDLGDCDLLSALAGLAQQQPGVLRGLVAERPDGTFAVALASGTQIVDRRFPTRGGRLLYAGEAPQPFFVPEARQPARANGKPIWPMVIEKALAQQRGGYAALDHELPALLDQLGQRSISLRPWKRGPDAMRAIVREAFALGLVVRVGNAPPEARAKGFTPLHAYTVVGVDGHAWTIRNPSGVQRVTVDAGTALATFRFVGITGTDLSRLTAIRVKDAGD